MRARLHGILGALALGVVPACTLALGYPTSTDERGAEACTNGIDDDIDGHADCEDPGCVGHCPDESGAHCTNGVDDDGDGAIDAHDAQCWAEPTIGIAVRRCASVSGSVFEPVLDPLTATRDWAGDGVILPDPRDATRWVMGVSAGGATLVSRDVTTGALLGTTLSASVYLPVGGGVRLVLPLADDRSLAPGSDAISVELDEGQSGVSVGSPTGGTWLESGNMLVGAGWRQVQVEISRSTAVGDLRVRVELGVDGGPRTLLRTTVLTCTPMDGICVPATWAPDEALGFGWAALASATAGPEAAALIADVRLSRPAHQPCDYPVPQLADDSLSIRVESAARGGGITCAITSVADPAGAPLGLASWRSDDDGVSWSAQRALDTTLDDAAALTWDGTAFVGGAIVRDAAFGRIVRVQALRSTDCLTWSVEPDLVPAGGFVANLRAGALDLAIGPFGEGGAVVHELSFRYGSGDLLTALSPTGAAGTFAPLPEAGSLFVLPVLPDLVATGPRTRRHTLRIGRDRVIVYGSGRDVRLLVEQADGWHARAIPLLAPSRVIGGFDSASARHAELVMLDRPEPGMPWPARLLYTGDGASCTTCAASGTADLFFGATEVPGASATP